MRGFRHAFDAVCKAEGGGYSVGKKNREETTEGNVLERYISTYWRVKSLHKAKRMTVRMYLLQDLWVDILYIIRGTEGQKNEARERHSSVA